MKKMDGTIKHDSNFGSLCMKKGRSFEKEMFSFLFQSSMGGGGVSLETPPCVRHWTVPRLKCINRESLSLTLLRVAYTANKFYSVHQSAIKATLSSTLEMKICITRLACHSTKTSKMFFISVHIK